MLAGTIPNYGWIMIGPETSSLIEDFAWYSNNLNIPGLQPSLYVTYRYRLDRRQPMPPP